MQSFFTLFFLKTISNGMTCILWFWIGIIHVILFALWILGQHLNFVLWFSTLCYFLYAYLLKKMYRCSHLYIHRGGFVFNWIICQNFPRECLFFLVCPDFSEWYNQTYLINDFFFDIKFSRLQVISLFETIGFSIHKCNLKWKNKADVNS